MKRKLIKEGITTEQKQQVLELSLTAEEAVLKLYKYVATNIQDNNIIDPISSLKTKIAEFNMQLKSRAERSTEVIETDDDFDNEGKTPSRRLESKQTTKTGLDLSEVWSKLIVETDTKSFKRSNQSFKSLIKTLQNFKNSIKEETKRVTFENAINDVLYLSENTNTFDTEFKKIYEWADKNNVKIIL